MVRRIGRRQIMIAMVAVAVVGAMLGLRAPLAQTTAPSRQPWLKLAAFPVPSEELLGATANGKLYVLAGLAPGWKPRALVYEYDPATDKWTEKKPMALPSHHVALVSLNDKIYAFGGFVLPSSGPPGWMPIDNAWEYDPAADSWKALAPMPSRRGAAAAAAVGGKIYVVGGAGVRPGVSDPVIHPARPHQVVGTVEEYDVGANAWRARSAMPTPRNHHAVAAVGGKIYAVGGRIGAAFITRASNTDLVEAYDPATDSWSGPLERMLGAFRAVESYDAAANSWAILPSMPQPRHGLAGAVVADRLHLVSGDVQSAGTGAHVDMDEHDALRIDLVEK